MKRLFVFILALTYLVASTGTNMHLHFCMGKLADLSLWSKSQKKTCSKCGMEKKDKPNGCCKDEHKWLKMQDDQKANVLNFELVQLQIAEPVNFIQYDFSPFTSNVSELLPNSHAPPRSCVAIHKRNCVFLI